MGILDQLGKKYKTDKATYHNYCDFYEQHLPSKIKRLLEIGVMDGNSLRMWKDFYPDAEIIGIDIKQPQNIEGVSWLQINSNDIYALKDLGKFDIIIDDGSHMTLDQQVSLQYLWKNNLKKNGYYIMEDLHTSLMPNYVNSKYTTLEILEKQGGWIFNNEPRDDSFTALKQKL